MFFSVYFFYSLTQNIVITINKVYEILNKHINLSLFHLFTYNSFNYFFVMLHKLYYQNINTIIYS
jgi:hypothetical protein